MQNIAATRIRAFFEIPLADTGNPAGQPYVTPANAGQATTSVIVSAVSGFMPTDPHVVVPDAGVAVDGRPLHDILQENSGNVRRPAASFWAAAATAGTS